jgi:putative heme-binding domain-containing protein
MGDQSQAQKYHSTPMHDRLLGHVARQSLLLLDAQDETISDLNSKDENLQAAALFTMKYFHSNKVVDALIARVKSAKNPGFKTNIVKTLVRLHQKEKQFDTSYVWWKTRPNPHGPYYYNENWECTEKINAFLKSYIETLDQAGKDMITEEMKRCQAISKSPKKKKKVQTVGKTSLEDLMASLDKYKGNKGRGKKVINKIGCIGCHNIEAGQTVKGPDLTQLSKVSKQDIAMSILRPADAISKSWVNITLKNGTEHTGTLIESSKSEVTISNIAGVKTNIKTVDIKSTEPGPSMMLMHLADSLTLQEFADLIEYTKKLNE